VLRKTLTALGGLGIAVAVISAVPPATALAYPPCQSSSTGSVSSPTVGPGGQVTFTVTFTDCNGSAVSGSQVTFSGSGPCQPTFNPPSGVTNQNGQVTTTVTFPPGCPGLYTLAAGTQGITVTASVRETGGFPNTTRDPVGGQTPLPLGIILVAALGTLLILTGSVALLARRRGAERL
jgi:hypothetical protein